MRSVVSYSLASVLVVLTAGFVAPASWLGLPVGARPVVGTGMTVQTVDRSNKSDRLDIPLTVIDKKKPATTVGKERAPAAPVKILDGCDPVFSPLSSSAQANLPGRCLA
ncbi:hypothetical protein MXD81_59275 [Microbacteriaceae bacterium K1510]|nr:hypothetical protein [Microbacteriaceae bacterium K1510]